jgi:hypothetical protein
MSQDLITLLLYLGMVKMIYLSATNRFLSDNIYQSEGQSPRSDIKDMPAFCH